MLVRSVRLDFLGLWPIRLETPDYEPCFVWISGGLIPRARYKFEGNEASRKVKWKYIRELCLPARQLILAGLTLYRLLLPRRKPIQRTAQDETAVHPPCDCLDRSAAASGAIASTVSPCTPWRKLLKPAERLAKVERRRRRSTSPEGLKPVRRLAPAR